MSKKRKNEFKIILPEGGIPQNPKREYELGRFFARLWYKTLKAQEAEKERKTSDDKENK